MKQTIQQINILEDFKVPQKGVSRISDRELVAKRNELKAIIKEANQILDEAIDPELFKRASSYKNREYGVDNNTVLIIQRPNFSKVPLTFAKKYEAVKLVPDSDILKVLKKEGLNIPGIKITEYFTVK
ncbi:MAG: hypothetical protein ACRDFB_03065 [Rhabdochlamydiaceae bacterium]